MYIEVLNTKITIKMLHLIRFSSYRLLPVLHHKSNVSYSLVQLDLLRLPNEHRIWRITPQCPAIISKHWWAPFPFVSALHCCNVLVETFAVLVTHRTTVLRKEVQMRTQKVATSFWHSDVPCLCCPTHTGNKEMLCPRAAVQAKVQWFSGPHKCSTCMCHTLCIAVTASCYHHFLSFQMRVQQEWKVTHSHCAEEQL